MADSDNQTPVTPVVPTPVEPAPAPVTPPAPSPAPTPTVVQDVVTDVKKEETSLQTAIYNWLVDVYDHNKILFYTIIPLVGLAYVVIKYRDILVDLLLGSAKRIETQTNDEETVLQQQADADKQAADNLVNQANDLPDQETPVDQNWDKK